MNSSIVLTTANARFSHSSLGLRCLFANLEELQDQTVIVEHTIQEAPQELVESWLSYHPRIIGIGVYIWNIELLSEAVCLLKQSHPEILVVLGGPEVSYGVSDNLFKQADYIIQREGEVEFQQLCSKVLQGKFPSSKVIKASVLNTDILKSPYPFYSDVDIKSRKIYVEASRGCAFKCHFCLSSLDDGIRNFDVKNFLNEIDKLYNRGARQFKFVDRTFNLDIKHSIEILNYFLEKSPDQDYFLHFEVIPDRLPEELKKYIKLFKPGVLQFEVGIQTFDIGVSTRIGRRQNKLRAIKNLTFLRFETNAHLHVDLIIGLPGATKEIFKQDLNELIGIGLQEVQVGILKNLKGTPLQQHIAPFHLEFGKNPPYEIISSTDIDSTLMADLRNFQKFWDKYYNSGNFVKSMDLIFKFSNPFDEFYKLSQYAFKKSERTFGISLDQLCEVLYYYFTKEKFLSHAQARELILKDIMIKKGRKVPLILRDYQLGLPKVEPRASVQGLERQNRASTFIR